MAWILLIIVLLFLAIFLAFSNMAKLPALKSSMMTKSNTKKSKSALLNKIAEKIAPLLPMGEIRKVQLGKTLKSAGLTISPQEYTARYWVRTAIFIVATIILLLIWWPFALISALFGLYIYINRKNEAARISGRRGKEAEKELLRFVSYVASRVKTTHNMLEIMTDYNANYDTVLTKELAVTIADMKTGNQEQAIMNLQGRISSPLMNELCRGIISAMRGDDVTVYFDNFTQKLMQLWNQRLKQEALKKEPKISRMTYVLLGCAFLSTFVVLAAVLFKSVSMIAGVA